MKRNTATGVKKLTRDMNKIDAKLNKLRQQISQQQHCGHGISIVTFEEQSAVLRHEFKRYYNRILMITGQQCLFE